MEGLLLLFLLVASVSPAALPRAGVCSGPYVELLVSPVVEDGYTRRITYQFEQLPVSSEIGVFDRVPDNGDPIYSVTVSTTDGWGNTTLDETHVPVDELGFKRRCLSLYVAYRIPGSNWQGINCLQIQPTWMQDLQEKIENTRLKDLYIPGTHDSSAYKEYNHDHPDDLITKHSVTQDEPILAQLIYGARYIDLRVGYYPKNPDKIVWWGNHGIMQFHPMSEIFADLTEFLKNTREIVILDVQEFPVGFGNGYDVHNMFVEYLSQEFEQFIVPGNLNWDSTVKEVQATGRQLIISYDNSEMVAQHDFLWPAVHQAWGDKQHVEDLMDYLANTIKNPPSSAWAAMAQLTPSASDIILNTMKGLRHAAEAVNHDVTEAFRTREWAQNTNVLAIDFLRGSGAVNAAIQWNAGAQSCGNSFSN